MTSAWGVIKDFNSKFFEWQILPFTMLNVSLMEESTMDWQRKINFVKKDTEHMKHDSAATFIFYMEDQLEKLRDFMTIIVALKTKGLERRHFTKIEKELELELKKKVTIWPQKLDLKYLSNQDLHQGEAVEIIKKYAAIAQKEYQIKVTLD